VENSNEGLIGYSSKINGTTFTDRQKKESRNLLISAFAAPFIFIAAFQIAAFFYTQYTRLTWLLIGAIIGVIVTIALLIQSAKRKHVANFEGELAKKQVRRKTRRDPATDTSETYYVHSLIFSGVDGKTHKYSEKYSAKKSPENSWSWYLQIGDKVRYHAKQDYFEKYDKSQDRIIPCAECHSFYDVELDNCPHCGAVSIKP